MYVRYSKPLTFPLDPRKHFQVPLRTPKSYSLKAKLYRIGNKCTQKMAPACRQLIGVKVLQFHSSSHFSARPPSSFAIRSGILSTRALLLPNLRHCVGISSMHFENWYMNLLELLGNQVFPLGQVDSSLAGPSAWQASRNGVGLLWLHLVHMSSLDMKCFKLLQVLASAPLHFKRRTHGGVGSRSQTLNAQPPKKPSSGGSELHGLGFRV